MLCLRAGGQSLASLLILLVTALLGRPVAADELGLYVGAGLGHSDVTLEHFPLSASDPVSFDGHATGWKVLAGLHPLPWIGFEAEHVDFGHPSEMLTGPATAQRATVPASVNVRGEAAFGIAYLPLPLPLVQFYGKLGAARVRASGDTAAIGVVGVDTCVYDPDALGCRALHDSRSGTRFAWGAGGELHVLALALRAEYERFGSAATRPAMASLSVCWNF